MLQYCRYTIHIIKQNPVPFYAFYSQIEQNWTNKTPVIPFFLNEHIK